MSPLRNAPPLELSIAGWFVILAGTWELAFNRFAAALGVYSGVGAAGALSWLASSGRLAMNATGIMGLILACVLLPRLWADGRFAPLPARVILMLASPFYLPIICVAIFRPVPELLVLIAYVVASASALFVAVLLAMARIDSSAKRLVIVLALVQVLAALELNARVFGLFDLLPRRAYLAAELLFFAAPIFGFLSLRPGRLSEFFRRPHLPALIVSCVATAAVIAVVLELRDEALIKLIAYRAIGVTVAIPYGTPLYVLSFFLGTLLVTSLTLPSWRWPPTDDSRRVGIGLALIWLAGVQPTHPYQYAIMLLGFLYLARGLTPAPRRVPSAPTSAVPASSPQ